MPRQMNLDSFAVLATRIYESLNVDDSEKDGVFRILTELSKLGVTTIPREVGLLHANTEASRIAAEAIQKSRGKLCQRVEDYLMNKGRDGATDAEMQRDLGMNPNTQRPRRIELQAAGTIVQSGEMRINDDRPNPDDPTKTITGLPATVWVLTLFYDPLNYHGHEAIEKREKSTKQKEWGSKIKKLLEEDAA